MVRVDSDVAGYKNKMIHDNGGVTYYNDIKMTDSLSRVMSRCWDSLPDDKKIEINKRYVEKQKKENAER
ncbi:hypothetical protein [Emergencia sp.]|uniref:hypothetical protein n=1 Tax=Emergencia sp. TaxID=1926557 RepID=UPI003AF02D60